MIVKRFVVARKNSAAVLLVASWICLVTGFVSLGADIHLAAASGDVGRLIGILSGSADTGILGSKDEKGDTPLQIALRKGKMDFVHYLLTNTPCVYLDRTLDSRTGEGQRAVESGMIKTLAKILGDLDAANPRNGSVTFGLGLAQASLGKLLEAQRNFERVLERQPANHRARAELARVYMLQGRPTLARREVERAASFDLTPTDRRILASCVQEGSASVKKGGYRFTTRGEFGYMDDNNVNVGPKSSVIGTVPIVYGADVFSFLYVPEPAQPRRAQGAFGAVFASAVTDSNVTDEWIWGGDIAYYQNWLDSDAHDHETLFWQGSVGPRYMTRHSILAVPVSVSHVSYGHERLVDTYSANPSHLWSIRSDPSCRWVTSMLIQKRDYHDLDGRDSVYVSIGEMVRKSFGQNGHVISMGLSLFSDFADEGVYANSGYTWRLGTRVNLPWRSVLHGTLSHTVADYLERETLSMEKRSDINRGIVLGFDKRIAGDWGVDLTYQHMENDSTFALYQYERDVWTVSTYVVF